MHLQHFYIYLWHDNSAVNLLLFFGVIDMKTENHRLFLIQEYEAASDDALFSQLTVAAIRKCSTSTIEHDRWAGTGVPFRKYGHLVRYRKSDIRNWLDKYPAFQSTTQAQYMMKAQQDCNSEDKNNAK